MMNHQGSVIPGRVASEAEQVRRRLEIRVLCLSAVLILHLCAVVCAQNFRFIHTSDTHVNPHRTQDSNAARNEELFREISGLQPRPAMAINTGDVVEVGSQLEYALLRERLKSMTVPCYHTPGNHDTRWNPLGKEGFVRGTGQPLFQHIEHEGVHFFLLDSTVLLEHWGHISQQQLDWLQRELDRIGPEPPVVLAFHHWIGRDKVQVDNEQDLIDLVEPYNVVLWLNGHGHSDLLWNINGAPAIMQKGLYQGSYGVIDVSPDHMAITRRHLAGTPARNEL
ncbi:MAG: metallophosphoesterase, partial [Phycisphaerae bacterium]|nr:metallophosphoesterase [Phycisphaerae bacterium]